MMLKKRILHQLYFFQLENYDIKRYLKMVPGLLLRGAKDHRQELVWTLKLKALTIVSFTLIFAAAVRHIFIIQGIMHFWLYSFVMFFVVFFVCLLFFPLFLIVAMMLLYFPDRFMKRRLILKATKKIRKLRGLTVIGIAGSYGKTTTKEVISTVLSEKFKVLKTPENINTTLGIAGIIQNDLHEDTQIFIVEMGEHQQGDIREICKMIWPKIGIITGINEAHLERMGALENTVATIFELAAGTSGKIFINADDELIMKNYKRYGGEGIFGLYGVANQDLCEYGVNNIIFSQDGSGYDFEIKGSDEISTNLHIALLGEYAPGVAMASVLVGKKLGLDMTAIKNGIQKVKSPKHRLELVPTKNGVTVIDDSYNGNPAGVTAAINVLNKFENKRKIYITPGLVEMGSATKRVHVDLGERLGAVANLVILIKNSVTDYITEGLKGSGFDMKNVLIFESAVEAHNHLGSILKAGDVVLFQNDWTDNYF